MGYLRSWVGMLIGVGHRNVLVVLIVGLVRIWLSMLFLNVLVHHMIVRYKFMDYLRQVLLPGAFESFFVISF